MVLAQNGSGQFWRGCLVSCSSGLRTARDGQALPGQAHESEQQASQRVSALCLQRMHDSTDRPACSEYLSGYIVAELWPSKHTQTYTDQLVLVAETAAATAHQLQPSEQSIVNESHTWIVLNCPAMSFLTRLLAARLPGRARRSANSRARSVGGRFHQRLS